MKHTLVLLASLAALLLASCTSLPSIERGQVRATDGTPIVWESQGQGSPALVLIHCWCGNRSFWNQQVDELARDHRVIRLDLPGHGESGHQRESWSVDGLGADVAQLADELGLQQMILIGHSMGGPVALCAAARLHGRVLGIVAVDTLHDAERGITREQIDEIARKFEADFRAGLEQLIPSMLPPKADPVLLHWLVDQAAKTDPRAASALMRNFPELDMPALFRDAGAPIRGINSANSPWPTNIAANRKYADYDAIVLRDVGHYLQLERPREFNAALLRTLAELEQR